MVLGVVDVPQCLRQLDTTVYSEDRLVGGGYLKKGVVKLSVTSVSRRSTSKLADELRWDTA